MKLKNFLFVFLFLFSLNLVLANTISLLPAQMNFVGEVGETICQNITIKIPELNEISVTDKWAKSGEKNKILSLYNLNSQDMGLNLTYLKKFSILEERKISVCLKGDSVGEKRGAILFKLDNYPIRAGVWVNVNLTKRNKSSFLEENPNSIITGKSILINENKINKEYNFNIFLIVGIVLFMVLLFLKFKEKF